MTIEVSLLISALALASGLYFNAWNKYRNQKNDTETQVREAAEEAKQEQSTNTMVMLKLEMIQDDLKEIKNENRNFREDISQLRERVAKVESSLKSYHKRLDGEKSCDE